MKTAELLSLFLVIWRCHLSNNLSLLCGWTVQFLPAVSMRRRCQVTSFSQGHIQTQTTSQTFSPEANSTRLSFHIFFLRTVWLVLPTELSIVQSSRAIIRQLLDIFLAGTRVRPLNNHLFDMFDIKFIIKQRKWSYEKKIGEMPQLSCSA